MSIKELIEEVLENTGYKKEIEAEGEIESETRLQNIEELINKAVSYSENEENPTLDGFLEEVALVADVDNMDESENRIVLMTLHSAKGLEFPYVYLSGLEDGLFPSRMSIMSDDKDAVEEERRLCYVGITRAREKLTLTMARQRMTNGETRYSRASRFVEEIPAWLLEQEEQPSVFSRPLAGHGEAHPLPLRTEALEKRLRAAGAEPAPASRVHPPIVHGDVPAALRPDGELRLEAAQPPPALEVRQGTGRERESAHLA